MAVRTRFAPSPTGSLHVGGARTALYCLLHARHMKGEYVLRIEDTDQARSTAAAEAGILADLEWLGLVADEDPLRGGAYGPYRQSERLSTYNTFFDELIANGTAYEAWETREELGAMRETCMKEKRNFRYKRIDYTDEQLAQFKADGREPILRLQHPSHDITVSDAILGPITIVEEELEDIVIRKTDGFPTYHFAVVVDDHLMGISQVLRGQEHMMNSHKHVGIMEALGWPEPKFGHLPTINNATGGKMSKRDKAKQARAAAREWHAATKHPKGDFTALAEHTGVELGELQLFMKKKSDAIDTAQAIATALKVELPMIEVMDFKKGGYLPEGLLNYLALLGWSPGNDLEIMTVEQMVELFTLKDVGRTSARFDIKKLTWMNGEYMKSLPDSRLLDLMDQWLEVTDSWIAGLSREQRSQLLTLYRVRCATFMELDAAAAFFVKAPETYDAKAVTKWITKGGGHERLAHIHEGIDGITDWTAAGIETGITALAASLNVGMGKIAQPLRVVLTGTSVSPGIGETLSFFTKDEVLRRIEAAQLALAPEG